MSTISPLLELKAALLTKHSVQSNSFFLTFAIMSQILGWPFKEMWLFLELCGAESLYYCDKSEYIYSFT